MANRNHYCGNEEERFDSAALKTSWKYKASGDLSSHGNAMTSKSNNSSGEEMQETDKNQSCIPEGRRKGPKNLGSPKGNGKGELNMKYVRKTEVCGTHTRKSQEKGGSTNNDFEFGQEKSNLSAKNHQRNFDKDVSRNETIMSLQPERNPSEDDSKDENETISQVVNDSIKGLFNFEENIDSAEKAWKDADNPDFQTMIVYPKKNSICKDDVRNYSEDDSKDKNETISQVANYSIKGLFNFEENIDSAEKAWKDEDNPDFQTMIVHPKKNSICKDDVSSQVIPVKSGENKEALKKLGASNENSSKTDIQQDEIYDNECNVFQSTAEHSSAHNVKSLQEITESYFYRGNVVADVSKGFGAAEEKLPVDENVAAAGTVDEHSFLGSNKELQGIYKSKLDYENFAGDENVKTVAAVTEHSSPDHADENVFADKSNISDFNLNATKEDDEKQKWSHNQPRSPYPNSLSTVPEIVKTVPKVLSTVHGVPISEFGEPSTRIISDEENRANEKLLKSNTCWIPIVPFSSDFAANNNEAELEPNQNNTAPGIFHPVSTLSNSTLKTAESIINEDSSTKLHEFFSSAKANPFDEKPLKPKSVMESSLPHSSNFEIFNTKIDVEMKQLTPLQSMKPNQLIYKLAYNESITSSETNSRSLSPVDPESQVPSSIINDEIIVHEADTDSDAGSEDIELIPHRYECETSLNKNRNIYVNKLSLAVELLRTQESLPYDDHFKRVVEDNDPSGEDPVGEVNFGFEEDSTTLMTSKGKDREVVVTSPAKSNKLFVNTGASSSSADADGFNDSCEEATESTAKISFKNRICTMCTLS